MRQRATHLTLWASTKEQRPYSTLKPPFQQNNKKSTRNSPPFSCRESQFLTWIVYKTENVTTPPELGISKRGEMEGTDLAHAIKRQSKSVQVPASAPINSTTPDTTLIEVAVVVQLTLTLKKDLIVTVHQELLSRVPPVIMLGHRTTGTQNFSSNVWVITLPTKQTLKSINIAPQAKNNQVLNPRLNFLTQLISKPIKGLLTPTSKVWLDRCSITIANRHRVWSQWIQNRRICPCWVTKSQVIKWVTVTLGAKMQGISLGPRGCYSDPNSDTKSSAILGTELSVALSNVPISSRKKTLPSKWSAQSNGTPRAPK